MKTKISAYTIVLWFTFFLSFAYGDIRKNKLVQENIPLVIKNNDYDFDFYKIVENPKAYKTAINIFEERYKNEKIDGIIVMKIEDLILAAPLAEKLGIPIIINKISTLNSFIKKKGRYLICQSIIKSPDLLKEVTAFVEKNGAFVMEIFCFTEILHFNARSEINAQIISIFLDRKTACEPKERD